MDARGCVGSLSVTDDVDPRLSQARRTVGVGLVEQSSSNGGASRTWRLRSIRT
jgi:hypothetical protein